MSAMDDIISALSSRLGGFSPTPAASIGGTAASAPASQPTAAPDPGPPMPIATPVGADASAPGPAYTPAVATPAPVTKARADDWMPAAPTMTPPSVANVPFANTFRQAAPQLAMLAGSPMGGILGAATQQVRKQYPFLGMPAIGAGSGDY